MRFYLHRYDAKIVVPEVVRPYRRLRTIRVESLAHVRAALCRPIRRGLTQWRHDFYTAADCTRV